MSLRDYARKRRFDGTPEPQDAPVARAGKRPIFVVQLHHASSRHYDFRLEMDGALKSWAVPKGPSLRPGEKRLAVEVEDHPLSYATFAGDIPEGHYGAGHVDVFDHGHWACSGDPLEGLAAGKLDFTLSGAKLQGAWKLVRTNMRGKQKQWLLMKRSDAHAADLDADALVEAQGVEAVAATSGGARVAKQGTPRRAASKKVAGRVATKRVAAKKVVAKNVAAGSTDAPRRTRVNPVRATPAGAAARWRWTAPPVAECRSASARSWRRCAQRRRPATTGCTS